MTKPIGIDRDHYYTEEDQKQCPKCFIFDQQEIVGKIKVDGVEQEVRKCGSCNRVYSSSEGFVQAVIDEAKDQGAESIEYSRFSTSATNMQEAIDGLDTYQVENKLEEVKQALTNSGDYNSVASKLDDVSTAVNSMSSNISNLVFEIQNVVESNRTLMEKLVKDPLSGMRKAVSDFNLE